MHLDTSCTQYTAAQMFSGALKTAAAASVRHTIEFTLELIAHDHNDNYREPFVAAVKVERYSWEVIVTVTNTGGGQLTVAQRNAIHWLLRIQEPPVQGLLPEVRRSFLLSV